MNDCSSRSEYGFLGWNFIKHYTTAPKPWNLVNPPYIR